MDYSLGCQLIKLISLFYKSRDFFFDKEKNTWYHVYVFLISYILFMNKLQTFLYAGVGSVLLTTHAFAAIEPGDPIDPLRGNASTDMVSVVQTFVQWVLGLLSIVAVIMGIYAGFLMVTAGWDEEKMKKGKHILMQVAIGIVVIILSYTFVTFIFNLFESETIG
jgi:prepilin signal peptidase PulO-like enzyme (type II secretory pathway)